MTPEQPVPRIPAQEAPEWHNISICDFYKVATVQAFNIFKSHPGSPVWHGVGIGFLLVGVLAQIADTLYDIHREIELKGKR